MAKYAVRKLRGSESVVSEKVLLLDYGKYLNKKLLLSDAIVRITIKTEEDEVIIIRRADT